MKKIFFMVLLMLVIFPVYAKEESFYYNDEKVENMWITRSNASFTRSANPYFVKRKSDNAYVYCVEPFSLVDSNSSYVVDNDYTKYGITKEQMQRVSLLMYYGYGYLNHNDKKWYGITQYLIWKTIDTKDNFYFSETKDGPQKNLYVSEINEIENMIKEHEKEPSFIKKYVVSKGEKLEIESNIDLNYYDIDSNVDYKIENNKFIINDLKLGEYKIKLTSKINKYKSGFMLYYSKDSQNVIIPGINIDNIKVYEFNISVKEGEIVVNKKNSLTKEKLEGATYGIYKDNKLVEKITTDSTGTVSTKLPFGKYIIKELEAPSGYKVDNKLYEFVIDENNLLVNFDLVDDKIVIKIPDTGLYYDKIASGFIVIGLLGLVYGKKKYYLH